MGGRRISWGDIESNLHIQTTKFRYFSRTDLIALWTTERLYDKGPYLAALCEANGTVIEKGMYDKRSEARGAATDWATGRAKNYLISEEP